MNIEQIKKVNEQFILIGKTYNKTIEFDNKILSSLYIESISCCKV